MLKKFSLVVIMALLLVLGMGTRTKAQSPDIHVVVNMVQLNVAVTDKNGNYITGLKPKDFVIYEDGIMEKSATFAEGDEAARRVGENGEAESVMVTAPTDGKTSGGGPESFDAIISGANVFVLFDTSDYMYRGFVFAQDAISDFIRSLGKADKIAFYSYSRDISRAASLTGDRSELLRAVRSTVAGDQAALYNALLLTLKDAAQNQGRKVVVVFSNGPDNSSVVPPEDVAEFAQSSGVSIYMISTQDARLEPVSTAVFDRMTAATGGKAYFAKNWRDESKAFASIRDDLAHLYSLSYYPKANANAGWRSISVRLVGERLRKYKVRTRNGYRPQPSRFSSEPRTTTITDALPQPAGSH